MVLLMEGIRLGIKRRKRFDNQRKIRNFTLIINELFI